MKKLPNNRWRPCHGMATRYIGGFKYDDAPRFSKRKLWKKGISKWVPMNFPRYAEYNRDFCMNLCRREPWYGNWSHKTWAKKLEI